MLDRSARFFLALRNDQLLIGEGADDRPDLDAKFACGAQASMAEGHLITFWLVGLGADEDWDVLTVLRG